MYPDFDFLEFDLGEVFRILYNAVFGLLSIVHTTWNFLTTNQGLNVDLPIFGEIWGVTFRPIDVIAGVGLLLIILLWMVKKLVPLA